MEKEKYIEFVKFCIVGTLCAGIDLLFFNLVRFFASYQLSVIAGFVISWLVNYFMSSYWTFQEKPTKTNFIGMLSAHLINLFVVRMGVMYVLVDVLSLNSRIAYIPTLIIAAITSFIMVRFCFKYKKYDTAKF